jgi:outer membrane biosynthesis protein TonB
MISSGDNRLDLSALRAAYDSSPFPALPPEYKGDKLLVKFSFVYGEDANAN